MIGYDGFMITNQSTTKLTTHTSHYTKTRKGVILMAEGKLIAVGKLDICKLKAAPKEERGGVTTRPAAAQGLGKVMYKNYPWGPRPVRCPHCQDGIVRQAHSVDLGYFLWCYVCGWKRS